MTKKPLTQALNTPFSRRTFLKLTGATGAAAALGSLTPVGFAQEPVTLTYWHGWTGEWEEMVQFVVDMFHETQDRIRIEPVVVPYDQFLAKLSAAIAAGSPPDVVTLFGSTAIPTLARQGAIMALEDVGIDLAPAQEWFKPDIYKLGQFEEKTYGLSYWAGDFALLYNKAHFEEAGLDPERGPTTIAELDEYAERLTVKEGDTITRMGFLPNDLWLWGTVFGGSFYDDAAKQVTANDPAIVEALAWIRSYPEKYGAQAVAAFQAGLSSERAQNLDPFIAGKYSMQIQGPWKLGDIRNFGSDIQYGVVAPPLPEAGMPAANWTWGDIQLIPMGSKDPAAAAEFILFTGGVGDPEGYIERVTWGDRPINVPVSDQVISNPAFQKVVDEYPGFDTFVSALLSAEKIGSPPVMSASAFYTERMTAMLERVMLLQLEPQAALDGLTDEVQRQFQAMGG